MFTLAAFFMSSSITSPFYSLNLLVISRAECQLISALA